ncbi:Serine--tRNA ligase, mitochondrial [Erysiphe neolycopersici]|uniref:serine--tRNA ligase n=1 Tax=Erysiphe neolycopersici TaxID=212602 RepID=A0A420I656_9PEZI|nr:Serine--tRNA ligase, mitochondrial [Erysiphe neolycopersici]
MSCQNMCTVSHLVYICHRCRNKSLKRFLSRSFHVLPSLRNENFNPTIAPKALIDIKHIRDNPALHERNCLDRNYKFQATYPIKINNLTEKWQSCQKSSRSMREKSNWLTRQLASKIPTSDTENTKRKNYLSEARLLKDKLASINAEQSALNAEIAQLALAMPNLTSPETPRGSTPKELGLINEEIGLNSTYSNRCCRSHVDIGQELNIIDFAGATTTSGWGWYYLLNEAALLEQALVKFSISLVRKRGWSIVSPPSMVYSHISDSCGFQPRDQNGEQQIYQIQQNPADIGRKPQLSLAGTAEIPIASMKANQTLEASKLPMKYVGVSRCYRAEAGARGADTKGLYRVHEFTKVEMFVWALPDCATSTQIFDEMHSIQREILTKLKLYCRILEMPSTELGASATRKIDIEAFFPSRQARGGGWGELTSLSNCTDYQARRLATRLRLQPPGQTEQLLFPYTLNGTALAVPRVLAAILENGWDEERGVVVIPEVLWPFMEGVREIGPKESKL